MRRTVLLAALMLLGIGCTAGSGEPTPTTPAQTPDTRGTGGDEPVDLATELWTRIGAGEAQLPAGLVERDRVSARARFLASLDLAMSPGNCQSASVDSGVQVTCELEASSPLVALVGSTETGPPDTLRGIVIVSDSAIEELEIPVLEDSLTRLHKWAAENHPDEIAVKCGHPETDPAGEDTSVLDLSPECGQFLSDIGEEFHIASARELLESISRGDNTAIAAMVQAPPGIEYTTDQLRNALRFALEFGWLTEVSQCELGTHYSTIPAIEVGCQVGTHHPLFHTDNREQWRLLLQGDTVVDSDLVPHREFDETAVTELHAWAQKNSPASTRAACGSDAYQPSEVFLDATDYPLHPRCARHLSGLVGDYLRATDSDHPIAILKEYEKAFNDEDLTGVLALFATDAVSGHASGIEAIANVHEEEFKLNIKGSLQNFLQLDEETVCFDWVDTVGNNLPKRMAVVQEGMITLIDWDTDNPCRGIGGG